MSVREEDRRKNCSSSSRGLGLAAAAIGVGVGAALYYFFSKRPEQPDTEGSTSEGWTVEQPQTLSVSKSSISDYTTISVHTTTDTSICITDSEKSNNLSRRRPSRNTSINIPIVKKIIFHSDSSSTDNSEMDSSFEDNDDSFCYKCSNNYSFSQESDLTLTDTEYDMESVELTQSCDSIEEEEDSIEDEEESEADSDQDSSVETGYVTFRTTSSYSNNVTQEPSSESDMEDEWDITNSSSDVPYDTSYNDSSPFFRNIMRRLTSLRQRNSAPRERRWSLEECAICFEVMLKDQPLMQLPCTHNFHVACIGPWLQEQQTCPMCRKAAE